MEVKVECEEDEGSADERREERENGDERSERGIFQEQAKGRVEEVMCCE